MTPPEPRVSGLTRGSPPPERGAAPPWGFAEALLLSLCAATGALAIDAVVGRADLQSYAAMLRADWTVAGLWLDYAVVYCSFGLLATALARLARLPRPAALLVTLLGLSLPPLVYAYTMSARVPIARSVLDAPAPVLMGAAPLLVLVAWGALGGRHARRAVGAALAAAPFALAALAVYGTGRRMQMPPGNTQLGWLPLLSAAVLVSALPVAAALWRAVERRSRGLLAAALGALLLLAAGAALVETGGVEAPRAAQAAPSHPPVLLIVADTLRADFISTLGGPPDTTPSIDALARDGVTFERAHSTASWTTPSFGSILSSTYPSEHGAGRQRGKRMMPGRIDRSLVTLPEVLSRRGYATAAVLSNAFVGPYYGFGQGFHRYQNYQPIEWYHPQAAWLETWLLQKIRKTYVKPYLTGGQQTVRHLDMLRALRATGRPWFLLAHYMDAHQPHIAPRRFYDGGGSGSMRDGYEAEVRHLDHHVGRLLSDLREKGEYERALIVFVADHGEELSEKRIEEPGWDMDHGHTLFEELLHVPLIVKLPGNRMSGTRRSDLVSTVDVAPTVLRALGMPEPRTFRGVDLLDAESAASGSGRVLFAEMLLYGPEQKAAIHGHQKVMLRELPPDPEKAEAYDLRDDPEERSPVPVSEVDGELRLLYRVLAEHAEAEPGPGPDAVLELDDLHRSELEALGYLR